MIQKLHFSISFNEIIKGKFYLNLTKSNLKLSNDISLQQKRSIGQMQELLHIVLINI